MIYTDAVEITLTSDFIMVEVFRFAFVLIPTFIFYGIFVYSYLIR